MELKRGVELAGCCLESSLWGACVSLKVILRRLSVLNPDQKRDQVRHAVDDPFLRSYKNRVSMEPSLPIAIAAIVLALRLFCSKN